jgi:hypothetical protein
MIGEGFVRDWETFGGYFADLKSRRLESSDRAITDTLERSAQNGHAG